MNGVSLVGDLGCAAVRILGDGVVVVVTGGADGRHGNGVGEPLGQDAG